MPDRLNLRQTARHDVPAYRRGGDAEDVRGLGVGHRVDGRRRHEWVSRQWEVCLVIPWPSERTSNVIPCRHRLWSLKGSRMAEESWHEARLIPTSGINGAEEQERRATSALLAVMGAVREFGRGLTKPLGAPAGTVQTFVEVPFELAERRLFPDGLIRVGRGQKTWTALVEVKTGSNQIAVDQLENYLDIAREQGFDAVITISNEIPAVPGQHPTKVDKRKVKKVPLHHWSWTQVLAEAVMQKEFRGVADPDQAWILGELIRYLEHPRSGALEFDDMGEAWVSVRDAVAASTLRPTNKGVAEVAARFDALLRFTSLRLGRQLGTEVTPILQSGGTGRSGTANRDYGHPVVCSRTTSRFYPHP